MSHSSGIAATRYLETMGRDVQHNSCFKGLFMHRLLTRGYHFQEWQDISIVKRVADAEVGWTLGYMIKRSNSAASATGVSCSYNLFFSNYPFKLFALFIFLYETDGYNH